MPRSQRLLSTPSPALNQQADLQSGRACQINYLPLSLLIPPAVIPSAAEMDIYPGSYLHAISHSNLVHARLATYKCSTQDAIANLSADRDPVVVSWTINNEYVRIGNLLISNEEYLDELIRQKETELNYLQVHAQSNPDKALEIVRSLRKSGNRILSASENAKRIAEVIGANELIAHGPVMCMEKFETAIAAADAAMKAGGGSLESGDKRE